MVFSKEFPENMSYCVVCKEGKETPMPQEPASSPQQVYTPAVGINRITVKHAMGKVFVTSTDDPDHVCGIARRIGYTGKSDNDLAIYRLKVRVEPASQVMTLPKLFVVEGGIFVEYEQWCLNSKAIS
jgi:hypothetical protein